MLANKWSAHRQGQFGQAGKGFVCAEQRKISYSISASNSDPIPSGMRHTFRPATRHLHGVDDLCELCLQALHKHTANSIYCTAQRPSDLAKLICDRAVCRRQVQAHQVFFNTSLPISSTEEGSKHKAILKIIACALIAFLDFSNLFVHCLRQ